MEQFEEARVAVSMIVGRDTQNLNKEGVTKANRKKLLRKILLMELLHRFFYYGQFGGPDFDVFI